MEPYTYLETTRGPQRVQLEQWGAEQLGLTDIAAQPVNAGLGTGYIALIGETKNVRIELGYANSGPMGQLVKKCPHCHRHHHPTGEPLIRTELDLAGARRRHRTSVEPCFDCEQPAPAAHSHVIDLTSRLQR